CLEEELEILDTEILKRMRMTPFQHAFTLLQTMPGVGELAAAAISGGNRYRYGSFSDGGADVQLGRALPGQARERGHPERQSYHPWQRLPANGAGSVRLGCDTQTGVCVSGTLPANRSAPRTKTRHCGGRPPDAHRPARHADGESSVSRCGERASSTTPSSPGASSLPLPPPSLPCSSHHPTP